MSFKYSDYKNQSVEVKEAWRYLLTQFDNAIDRNEYVAVRTKIKDAIVDINDLPFIDTYVIEAIKFQLSIKEVDVTKSLHELGADSLDYIEIIMYIEEELDIEISDEKASNLNNSESTVQQLIDMVKSLH